MSIITFLSLYSFSKDELPSVRIPHLDKIVHAVFYFGAVVLGCLFIRERTAGKIELKKALWTMCLVAVVYGILIEALQGTMTLGRDGNSYDAMANALGALAGVWAIHFFFSSQGQLKWRQ